MISPRDHHAVFHHQLCPPQATRIPDVQAESLRDCFLELGDGFLTSPGVDCVLRGIRIRGFWILTGASMVKLPLTTAFALGT